MALCLVMMRSLVVAYHLTIWHWVHQRCDQIADVWDSWLYLQHCCLCQWPAWSRGFAGIASLQTLMGCCSRPISLSKPSHQPLVSPHLWQFFYKHYFWAMKSFPCVDKKFLTMPVLLGKKIVHKKVPDSFPTFFAAIIGHPMTMDIQLGCFMSRFAWAC